MQTTDEQSNTFADIGNHKPVVMNFYGNWAAIVSSFKELLVFTSDWYIYDRTWMTYDLSATDGISNFAIANWVKYILGNSKLFTFTNKTTVSASLWNLTSNIYLRPWIDFYWDLIFWDGKQVGRYNKDGTLILYSSSTENPVIWGLDGNVFAITRIWPNIYVWCNDCADTLNPNWKNTNLYVWDWVSSRPIQKITYTDKPVINVALLWASHYWWSQKSVNAMKNIFIGESYQPTRYVTSNIPNSLSTGADNDQNILGLYGAWTNAIETVGDIVYIPWYWRVFWFGKYFPESKFILNREFTFSGSECTAMLSGEVTPNSVDCTNQLFIAYNNGSNNYKVGYYDFRDYNGLYTSSGYIESMEYVSNWLLLGEDQNKFIIPFELTNSACTITVSVQIDRSGSYTAIKTINSTDYWTWFTTAELKNVGKWDVIQFRFDLATSNTTYSPKLRVGMTNQSSAVWNLARR